MSTTQQPPTTPSRSLACDAAEARLLLAAAGSGEAVVIRRPCVEAMDVTGTNPAASVHPDGSGKGWIAWWPRPVSAEETARIYPGDEGFRCPYGKPGETVDVLEPHAFINQYGVEVEVDDAAGRRHKMTTVYEAGPVAAYRKPDGEMEPTDVVAWLPADSMPPWAVRMTLRVESVAVARSDAGAWCWEVVVKSERKGRA